MSAEIERTTFEKDGVHHNWMFSSMMSREFKEDVVNVIHTQMKMFKETLSKGKTLIVTFGTSWCYFLNESPEFVVANCHKMPAGIFLRRRLGVDEIVSDWNDLINNLRDIFPGIRIIFTVSPVRHLKDGFEGNSRSKAVLQLAVEQICAENQDCEYFPAFELMNDDLRDYRFYASDLVHPSEEGVEYIWEKFCGVYMDGEGKETLREGSAIFKAYRHRNLLAGRVSTEMESRQSLRRQELERRWEDFSSRHPNALAPS